jgi:hypothetical protein
MDHDREKQKQFSNRSRLLTVALAIFTGVIMITIPLAPVLVFAANIDGTSGDDTLNGTPEADTINGFEGNDLIFGEGGDDILDGSKGDDEIRGGDGNDEIKDGNDGDYQTTQIDYGNKVYGGPGNDNIDVGIDYLRSDFYYVYGEGGADYIEVVSNADIKGGLDDDTIYCTGFECTVNGDEGHDEIHIDLRDVGSYVSGGSGNDEVFGKGYGVSGDEGNDYLSLDSAVDLKGGEGDDVLEVLAPSYETYYNGGPGADTFNCSPGPGDIVEDYNPGEGDTVSTADCETVQGTTPPEPIQTVLTLNTITSVPWGKDVTVTGKLVDANNAGIGGKTITFDGTGADSIQDVVTNTDGTFTAKGASPTSVATGWKVQAHFAGDSGYTASDSSIKTYNTVKHSVSLTISAASSNVPWSMPTKFTATLKDNSLGGVAVSGKTIHFDGTGVIIPAASDQTTDSSGKAIATGTAPDTVASGWTYQAHFAGDSLYNAKDSSVKSYSTIKHSVSLSLSVPSNAVSEGASFKVSGTLTDSTAKKPLTSKTITFTADEPITIEDKTTNTNGYYSSTQAAPSSAGTYDIQSHFAGDSLYKARDSAIKTLTVTAS